MIKTEIEKSQLPFYVWHNEGIKKESVEIAIESLGAILEGYEDIYFL